MYLLALVIKAEVVPWLALHLPASAENHQACETSVADLMHGIRRRVFYYMAMTGATCHHGSLNEQRIDVFQDDQCGGLAPEVWRSSSGNVEVQVWKFGGPAQEVL